jgi:hypothetical protein
MTIKQMIEKLEKLSKECKDGLNTKVHLHVDDSCNTDVISIEKYELSGGLSPVVIIYNNV